MFGVVMAGGGGTRLWPKSREEHPKQMHPLVGKHPLVKQTAERLHRILGENNVFIITNSHHAEKIKDIMPSMSDKIMVDPFRRDTAPCIGLAAVYLQKIDPEGVMGVFPADPHIADEEKFGGIVIAAEKMAKEGRVVTIGITPTGPETGFGYIEMNDKYDELRGQEIYRVARFVEKPNQEKADEYFKSGRFLWNSGIFIWSIKTILSLFKQHLPDTYEKLMRISDAIGTPAENETVMREYEAMECISVDYGIMEKLTDVLVIPGSFGWKDIGSWATVYDIASKDINGNAVEGQHISVDTERCLVLGTAGKIVATIGIQDMIIVDTPDALLVCSADRSQDVKKIVEKLKDSDLKDYL